MTEENELGIFADMPIEEIVATLEERGLLLWFSRLTWRIHKKWVVYVKPERTKGMSYPDYREVKFICVIRSEDELMTAVRKAANLACFRYSEPEIEMEAEAA